MKIKPPLLLLAMILVTTSIIAIAGVLAKHTVCHAAGLLQDNLALTIPFLLMNDPTLLQIEHLEEITPDIKNAAESSQQDKQTVLPGSTGVKSLQPSSPQPVEEAYFDDALFIGDSRTEGLAQYGRLGQADYFASSGMSVFNVLSKVSEDMHFASTDLGSLLAEKQYSKIYIMLGINELGYPLDSIIQQYQNILAVIQAAQPMAKIILCANIHVTKAKSSAVSWLSPENITQLNKNISQLADDQTIFYLDANALFCDDNGYLKPEMTSDGVHPYATGYKQWADWLQEHGIL